jgi:hypothetical protein
MAENEEAPVPSITDDWDVYEVCIVLDDYLARAVKNVGKLGAPYDAKGVLLTVQSKLDKLHRVHAGPFPMPSH